MRLTRSGKIDQRINHPKIDRNISPLPGEIWKDIKEWKGRELRDGYQVSNLGRVRNLGRVIRQQDYTGKWYDHNYPACMLKLSKDEDGYSRVCLCYPDRRTVNPGVHQLVATLFLTTEPKSDQTHVNHIDGNKENNIPSNLEWATPAENNKHARDHGLARLGTSQAIKGRIIEWDKIFSSKGQTDKALNRYSGYIDYCKLHGLPIIDKTTNQEVHVEWLQKEDINEK